KEDESPVFVVRGLTQESLKLKPGLDDAEGEENIAEGVDKDSGPTWSKVERALGLGPLSYAALGLAIFIIFLNNVLGLGWLTRMVGGETGAVVDYKQPFQVFPLDDPSNLLR
ncbi:unnamed protein product, partial [Discosporangium mesarthrocarpum]